MICLAVAVGVSVFTKPKPDAELDEPCDGPDAAARRGALPLVSTSRPMGHSGAGDAGGDQHHFLVRQNAWNTEHQVPIWFFIGGTLLVYGLIICGTGLYALVRPEIEAGLALNWLHPSIWWGAVMAVVGAFYFFRFFPRSGQY